MRTNLTDGPPAGEPETVPFEEGVRIATAAREARRVRDAKHLRATVAAGYEWDQARQAPDVLREQDPIAAVQKVEAIALATTTDPAVRDRIRGIAEQKMRKAKVQAERLARRLLKSRGRDISATAILDESRSRDAASRRKAARARGSRWTETQSIDARDAKIAPDVRRLKRTRDMSNRGIAERLGISPARVARILRSKK